MSLSRRTWSFVLRCCVTGLLLVLILSRVHWYDRLSLGDGTQLVGRFVSESNGLVYLQLRDGNVRKVLVAETAPGEGGGPALALGLSTYARRLSVWRAALVLLVFGVAHGLTALRWKLLLSTQGATVSFRRTLALTWIGLTFSNVLLGTFGGDAAKAYYIARGAEGKAKKISTVLMDRLVGLLGLAVVGGVAAALAFGPRRCLRAAAAWSSVAVWVLCAVLLIASLAWVLWRIRRRQTAPGEREPGIEVRTGTGRPRAVLREVITGYRHSVYMLVGALGISMGVHLVVVVGNVLLGKALGLPTPVSRYFFLVPGALLVSALPISVAGWGVGDAAFVTLFGMVGAAREGALALSVLSRLGGMVFWGLPGLVLIVRGMNEARAKANGLGVSTPS